LYILYYGEHLYIFIPCTLTKYKLITCTDVVNMLLLHICNRQLSKTSLSR